MTTDRQLVLALAGDGRESALRELIDRHGRMVERTALRLVRDPQMADDVSQAVFLVLLEKSGSLTGDGSLAGWLHRTAVLVARHQLRSERRRRRRESEAAKTMHSESTTIPAIALPAGFDEALERLPEMYRHAIELRFLEGRSSHEIATMLGMKPSAIDMRIWRGLERLRRALGAGAQTLAVAALAQALTTESAQAAAVTSSALQIETLITASAEAKPALLLAKGTVKSMLWLKIKTVIATACASACIIGGATALLAADGTKPKKDEAIKREGPLAALPSAPGPHIEKIKALGDGEWLNLGRAAPDPKYGSGSVRSWSNVLPYAADLGGAFNCGQGPHGYIDKDGYYDDIFFYDLYAHRWICLYPGINTRTFVDDIKKGEIKIGDKGYMVYKDGQAVHAWGHHTYHRVLYDSDRGIFITTGWSNGLGGDGHVQRAAPRDFSMWYVEGCNLLDEQMKGKNFPREWPAYCYDTKTGKLTREGGTVGNYYLPSKKAVWLLWDSKTLLSTIGDTHPSGPVPQVAYPQLCDFPACQDTKRDRIYVGRKNPQAANEGDFYIYDVATNAWSNPPCKGTIDSMPACNNGVVHYDSVNDKVIVMGGWCGQGKPEVHVWDPENHAWGAPIPIKAPVGSEAQYVCVAGFYSPEVNAHFLLIGIDGEDADWWVYRYKRGEKK